MLWNTHCTCANTGSSTAAVKSSRAAAAPELADARTGLFLATPRMLALPVPRA